MTDRHLVTAATYALLWEQEKAETERLHDVLRDLLDLIADGRVLSPEETQRVKVARASLKERN